MASGYNKWVSPRQAPSPKRKRVQELRDKFEALSDKSTGKGSGKESSQGYSRGRGSGTAHQGSGSGYGQTSGPSSEYSDSLRDQSDEPSFSKVLESTRLDGREGQQLSGDVEPTGMEPEGFQYPAARQKDPEPSRGATGGFRYPDYGTPKLPPQKADESSKYESMDYVKWYVDNVDKVSDFDMLCFEICLLLRDHVPGIKVDGDYSADLIVMMLKTFVKELLSKFRKFDLDLAEIEGFEMADKIHDHKRKVLDVIDELEDKLEDSKEEVATVKRQLGEVYAALLAAEETIEHLKASQERECAAGNDKQFMEKLQMSISDSVFEHYEQEIEHLKHDNKKLRQQLRKSTRQTVETEEQCMQDLSDASQRSDLNSKLKEALMSMLDESEEKQPNRKDAMKVVSKWYDHIKSAMRENEEMIDDLWQRYESSTKDRAHLAGKCDALEEEMEQLKSHITTKQELIEILQQDYERLENQMQELQGNIENLDEQMHQQGTSARDPSADRHSAHDSYASSPARSRRSSGYQASSPHSSGSSHGPPRSQQRRRRRALANIYDPQSTYSSPEPPRRLNLNAPMQHSSDLSSMSNDDRSRRRHTSDHHSPRSSLTTPSPAPRPQADDDELLATHSMEFGSDESNRRGGLYNFHEDIEKLLATRKLEPKPNTSGARREAFQDQLNEANRIAEPYSPSEYIGSSEEEHSHSSHADDDSAVDDPEDNNQTGSYRAPSPNILGRVWAPGDIDEQLGRMQASPERGSRRGSPENVQEEAEERRASPPQSILNRRWGVGELAEQFEQMQGQARSPAQDFNRRMGPGDLSALFARMQDGTRSSLAPTQRTYPSHEEDAHAPDEPLRITGASPEPGSRRGSPENIQEEAEVRRALPQPNNLNRRWEPRNFAEQFEQFQSQARGPAQDINRGMDTGYFADEFARVQDGSRRPLASTQRAYSSHEEDAHAPDEHLSSMEAFPERGSKSGSPESIQEDAEGRRAPSLQDNLNRRWGVRDLAEQFEQFQGQSRGPAQDFTRGINTGDFADEFAKIQDGTRRPLASTQRAYSRNEEDVHAPRAHLGTFSQTQSRRGATSDPESFGLSDSTGRRGPTAKLNETFSRRRQQPKPNETFVGRRQPTNLNQTFTGRRQPPNLNATFTRGRQPANINETFIRMQDEERHSSPSHRSYSSQEGIHFPEPERQPQDLNRRWGPDDFNQQHGNRDFAEQFERMQADIGPQSPSFSRSDNQSNRHSPQRQSRSYSSPEEDVHPPTVEQPRQQQELNRRWGPEDFSQPAPQNSTFSWSSGYF